MGAEEDGVCAVQEGDCEGTLGDAGGRVCEV